MPSCVFVALTALTRKAFTRPSYPSGPSFLTLNGCPSGFGEICGAVGFGGLLVVAVVVSSVPVQAVSASTVPVTTKL
ncbi:Uncharacterised protein [Mycobacteroides abscessus subsp. massiliense]|nr:Uncharacterised protein [Mycobacteroides abscessus subsp. massiliense]